MLKYFYIFAALSFVFLIMTGKAHAESALQSRSHFQETSDAIALEKSPRVLFGIHNSKNSRTIDNDLKKISKPYIKVD